MHKETSTRTAWLVALAALLVLFVLSWEVAVVVAAVGVALWALLGSRGFVAVRWSLPRR